MLLLMLLRTQPYSRHTVVEEEEEPGEEEGSPPGAHSMTGEAVTHRREGAEQCEEAPGEHHPVVLFTHLAGESHRDESDPANQVADVEEEEASEETEAGVEQPRGLLAAPQVPQGRAEIPGSLHGPHSRCLSPC